MHRDHVPTIPLTTHLLGSTSISMNQGMVRFRNPTSSSPSPSLDNVHVLTVQGHPEFTKSISSIVIDVREKAGIIDKDTAEDSRRRADWRNDGVSVFGSTFWKVMGVS
jgi:GMP synthase-like glutamine amidotransferase